jgi:chromosome segregation ATPase
MTTKTNQTDPVSQAVAAAQAAEDAGIAELESAERHLAEVRAQQANLLGPAEAAYETARQTFGEAKAAKDHAEAVAQRVQAVETAHATYAATATTADKKYNRVLELLEQLAAARADFYPDELARVQAGEQLKSEVRALDQLEPGIHGTPVVADKRLAADRPDAREEALRGITLEAHPPVKDALNRLIAHRGWQPPQFAMVQGRPVQVS